MEALFKANLDKLLAGAGTSHVILAVSGGIDSVVMARLFKVSGYDFSIAHCNFQLRGADSIKDEVFVRELGRELGVDVEVEHFNTSSYAKKSGISIQMAARELRYNWFDELIAEKKALIATAHHANDVAETILFNLAKGTGLAGLHGIIEKDDKRIRPMLWAKKAEIEEYADDNHIIWRQDQSNQSDKYMRNIIRQKIVPQLERINPAFIEASLRTTGRVKNNEDFIQYAIGQLGIIKKIEANVYIDKKKLHKLPGNKTVLYQLIRPFGFSYDQVNSIIRSLDNIGSMYYVNDWVLNVDRQHLILSKSSETEIDKWLAKEDTEIVTPVGRFTKELLKAKDYSVPSEPKVAALDLGKLVFPLRIRCWRQGDFIVPLGMTGKKKVSDILIDKKVPLAFKKNILVLLSGEKIVWVVGMQLNEEFKITSNTKNICQITWLPN